MGQHVHVLDRSTIDTGSKTIVCRACGPIDMYVSSGGHVRCGNAYRQNLKDQNGRPRGARHKVDVETARAIREIIGHCQGCGAGEDLQLEHNHETGEFRGVVCRSCNRFIASLDKMGPEILFKLIRFLGWRLPEN